MILDSKMALFAATQIIKEHLHKPIVALNDSEQKDLFRAYAYLQLELGTRGLIDMIKSLDKQISQLAQDQSYLGCEGRPGLGENNPLRDN